MKRYFLTGLMLLLGAVSAYPRYYGDINNDGKVDVQDIALLVNMFLNNGKPDRSGAYDVDESGTVDTDDVAALREYVLSGNWKIIPGTDVDAIYITYADGTATYEVPSAWQEYATVTVSGGDVTVTNTNTDTEYTTYLTGTCTDGSFTYTGSYKTTIILNGVELTNSDGAAVNIDCGKRIALTIADGTTNTLVDGTGSQKAALYSKGHLEIAGSGTLNVTGNTKHAISSKEYIQLKKDNACTINILGANSDGIHAGQYFKMADGTVNISGIGGDGIQAEASGATDYDEEEQDGSLSITGGTLNIKVTADDAAALQSDSTMTIKDKDTQITITTTGAADKGMKADGSIVVSNGTLKITQSGNLIATTDDISYSTALKAEKDITVKGGSLTIDNTAAGGKGISADGNVYISEGTVDITANGTGGTAESVGSGTSTETAKSYKVYIALPTTGSSSGSFGPGSMGQSNYWTTPIYLYSSDGTQVAELTSTVSKTSGSTTKTFYYYDFGQSDSGTYYIKGKDYTSSGWGSGGGGFGPSGGSSSSTTYTILSGIFSGPTSGEDYYYEISNSKTTSGTTYTFSISNVTNTWNGSTSDTSEEDGTAYNASGIKADGNVTISGGTITVKNSGEMSKSIKSKARVQIDGGDITLTPSGAMKVISSDASYSTGVKAVNYLQNDGSLTVNASGTASRGVSADSVVTNGGTLIITNTGGGQSGTNDSYTAKCIKADTLVALNAGTITLTATGDGGKGIKSSGTYTQGTSDGNGPKLTISTTGSAYSSSSSSGSTQPGQPGGGGMSESSGADAKAIKVQGAVVIYGGETEISTATDGAEGLESKTSIDIRGGKHYFHCYDDCINSSGCIYFNGGATVCYGYDNDAVDSNYGRTGAITIGNGTVFAYSTTGSPEEGLDCDDNSYIVINGTGTAISAGGAQGGGGGMGGSSSSSSIGSATQGYYLSSSTISYQTNTYYTLADASGNNMVTYSFEGSVSSSLSMFTASGMTKGSSYTVKSSTSAPTDATTAWHGLYLGSSASGTSSVTSFTAQ